MADETLRNLARMEGSANVIEVKLDTIERIERSSPPWAVGPSAQPCAAPHLPDEGFDPGLDPAEALVAAEGVEQRTPRAGRS